MAGDHAPTADHALAQVARRVPDAIICLLSALRFHELTTQLAPEVWIALPEKACRPRLRFPPLKVVRISGRALSEGVESHRIEGVDVRITSVARTVADCFKYRNKIGLDVALQALREAWQGRRLTMNELDHYGRVCRVDRVMRPYLGGPRHLSASEGLEPHENGDVEQGNHRLKRALGAAPDAPRQQRVRDSGGV